MDATRLQKLKEIAETAKATDAKAHVSLPAGELAELIDGAIAASTAASKTTPPGAGK